MKNADTQTDMIKISHLTHAFWNNFSIKLCDKNVLIRPLYHYVTKLYSMMLKSVCGRVDMQLMNWMVDNLVFNVIFVYFGGILVMNHLIFHPSHEHVTKCSHISAFNPLILHSFLKQKTKKKWYPKASQIPVVFLWIFYTLLDLHGVVKLCGLHCSDFCTSWIGTAFLASGS